MLDPKPIAGQNQVASNNKIFRIASNVIMTISAQYHEPTYSSDLSLTAGHRRAAFTLGYNSRMIRVWLNLFHGMPQPDFESVPLCVDEIDSAAIDLLAFLHGTTLPEIRLELECVSTSHHEMRCSFESSSVAQFNAAEKRCQAHAERIYRIASQAILQPVLQAWTSLGMEIGTWLLCTEKSIETPLTEVLREAEGVISIDRQFLQRVPVITHRRMSSTSLHDLLCRIVELCSESITSAHAMWDLATAIQRSFENDSRLSDRAIGQPPPARSSGWHSPLDPKPQEFAHGPLSGNLKDLAKWVLPQNGQQDPRALRTASTEGRIWINALGRTAFEAWFPNSQRYADALARHLQDQAE